MFRIAVSCSLLRKLLSQILLATCCHCLLSASLSAAEATPWSVLEIHLSGILPLDTPDALERHWSGGEGLQVVVGTPFPPGRLQVGGVLLLHPAAEETMPDFLTRYLFLGWEWQWLPLNRVELSAGLHCGNCNFYFDDTNTSRALKSESEFAVGLTAGLEYRFNERWLLHTGWRQTTMFTRHRIELTQLTAGIGYCLYSPVWLRELLR